MGIGDHMDEFADLHVAFTGEHVDQDRILGNIECICRKDIL